jgi:APA family basic amino acid/polyamine antiporter
MPHGITGVFAASALIFFAYQGFEAVVKFSDETMEPQITVPRALLFALVISVVLYILVAFCAVSILSWEQIAVSEAPFADIVAFSFGTEMVVIISLIALFATANTALLSMYASTRIAYGMAGSFSFPKAFGWVHPARNTPWVTIGLIGLFSVLFVFSGSIAFVANLTNFTLFITFIVINAEVLALRYHEPDIPRPFRIPGSVKNVPLVPVAGLFFSVILLTQLELPVMLLGLVLAGTGVAITFLKTRSV